VNIGVITTSRADFGIYLPLLKALDKDSAFKVGLYVGGQHLLESQGYTIEAVRASGISILGTFDGIDRENDAAAISRSIGGAAREMAITFERAPSNFVFCLGDRFEMFAAVSALVPFQVPLGHLHGGERTDGAVDERFRHAISKLSDYHFVSTAAYKERVCQLGEDPNSVFVVGALSLDDIHEYTRDLEEVNQATGLNLQKPPFLVTFHPETNDSRSPTEQIAPLLSVLAQKEGPFLLTEPNMDAGSRGVSTLIHSFVEQHASAYHYKSLGKANYFSLLRLSPGVIGNSSSGILEAASFHCPALNIGERQAGRIAPANVIHVVNEASSIEKGFKSLTAPDFILRCQSVKSPYGDGQAAAKIISALHSLPAYNPTKRFHDLP